MKYNSHTKHAYGWKRDLPDHRDKHHSELKFCSEDTSTTLPKEVDLRPHMPPVYNQGHLGACTAFAVAGALGYDFMKQGLSYFEPSELFNYYNERWMSGTTSYDSGATCRDAIKAIAMYGTVPTPMWPYNLKAFTKRPPSSCYVEAQKHKIKDYGSVRQSEHDIKTVLSAGYPIVFGTTLYTSFESDSTRESGMISLPKAKESPLGGHAILLCGYDDSTQRFTVRNSWGSSWGKNGYCFFPYSYILNPNLTADFWAIRTAP